MKTLTLLRHAKSGGDDGVARDFDRPLNAKGKRAATMMGRHLRALGAEFDHVVASPALRVMETMAEVEAGYGRRLSPNWDRRIYLASATTLLELVHDLPGEAARVLMVGHNPGMEELVLMLTPDGADGLRAAVERKYPTASIAEMTFEGDWANAAAGEARLVRFVRPRDVDRTLGPDYD